MKRKMLIQKILGLVLVAVSIVVGFVCVKVFGESNVTGLCLPLAFGLYLVFTKHNYLV